MLTPAEIAFVPVVTEATVPMPSKGARSPERAAIEITIGKVRVAVRAGADAKTLDAVLAALKRVAS